MADRLTAGREFLKGVAQHLPDELRAQLEAHIADPNAAAPFLNAIGDGTLRQSEFSSTMDGVRKREQELREYAGKLDDYRKTLEAEAARFKAPAGDPPNPNPGGDPNPKPAPTGDDAPLTMRELGDVLNRREAYYAQYGSDIARIAVEHYNHFKEVLDTNALLQHPKLGELGLVGAWKDLHKPKFEKLATDNAAAERAQIEKEVRAKILAEQAQTPAYPLAGGSPLDGLGANEGDFSAASAAALYDSLVSPG